MGKKIFLKVCQQCQGYVSDSIEASCPVCGNFLVSVRVDSSSKGGYKPLSSGDADYWNHEPAPSPEPQSPDFWDRNPPAPAPEPSRPVKPREQRSPAPAPQPDDSYSGYIDTDANTVPVLHTKAAHGGGITCSGTIYNYHNTDNDGSRYYRPLLFKLIDLLMYNQRTEDVKHHFRLRMDGGRGDNGMSISEDIEVNVHGTILEGVQLRDKAHVTVTGKMKRGVLMASSVTDDSSGRAILFNPNYRLMAELGSIVLMLIISIFYIGSTSTDSTEAVQTAKTLFWTTAGIFAVLLVLFGSFYFSRALAFTRAFSQKKSHFPGVLLLNIAFGLAILLLISLPSILRGLITVGGTLLQLIIGIIILAALFKFIVSMLK